MSADTATVSPTVRLTAYRPPSRTGAGFAILIRRGGSLRFGAGISPWSIRQVDHMNLSRTSGVQLHPTSLPSGRLGPDAYAWVDWLAEAGQTWWQMLPLGPPDEHDSPYKSASAFAASPKLLGDPAAPVTRCRAARLPRAGRGLDRGLARVRGRGRARRPGALRPRVARAARLRRRARREADRRHPDLRRRAAPPTSSRTRRSSSPAPWPACRRTPSPTRASCGATRSMTGRALRRQGYAWWTARFKRVFELFDLARIDHFRGFVAYWAVPADAEYALEGAWKRGPGRAPFDAARAALGELPLIAEDLGVITPPVTRLRESLGLPGMSVLQFGFTPAERHTVHVPENNSREPGRLHRHPRQRHDPRLVRVDHAAQRAHGRRLPRRATGSPTPSSHWALIRLVFASPGGDRDDPDPGRARARLRGPHEPAGQRRRVGLAARRAAWSRTSRSACARRARRPGRLHGSLGR